MTPTQKFEAYLKPILISAGHVYVEFADGDTIDRFNEDTVRSSCYPSSFVIAADYRIDNHGEGNIHANFKAIIYFLVKKIETNNPNLFADENTAFATAEAKLLSVYKKLRIDNDVALNIFPRSAEWHAQRVKGVTIDDALGYEVTTNISIPISDLLCP